jgi:hypothetical protein
MLLEQSANSNIGITAIGDQRVYSHALLQFRNGGKQQLTSDPHVASDTLSHTEQAGSHTLVHEIPLYPGDGSALLPRFYLNTPLMIPSTI